MRLNGQQMRFISPGADTLTESIYLSVCSNDNKFYLATVIPKNNVTNIGIGFVNGDIEYLPLESHGEFKISERALNKLKTIKFDTVFFEGDSPYTCINIKTKDYFINALNP